MTFNVSIHNTGYHFTVEPEESVIDAAMRAGLMLPYSCRNGTCGSCMGRVIEGQIQYPDGLPPAIDSAQDQAGMALFCQARPASDLVIAVNEVQEAGDIRPQRLPARVEQIQTCAPDVRRLFLRLPAAKTMPFLAGQYVDILLRDGQRRSYSLANAPHASELLELHIRHLPGGVFSEQVFTTLKEGALLRFEGPLGNFHLREQSDRPMLFIAGGTGFGPIKGIIEHALHIGCTQPMHIYWGARDVPDLYLTDLPTQWAQTQAHIHYTPVLSEPSQKHDWSGAVGFVHEQVLNDYPDMQAYDVYMAGPPPMINAAKAGLTQAGLPPERLFYDSFEAGGGQ